MNKLITRVLLGCIFIFFIGCEVSRPIEDTSKTIENEEETSNPIENENDDTTPAENEDTPINGSLAIDFTTRVFTGPYDTTAIAVWIETLDGEFVKTVYARGTYPLYIISLVDWLAKRGEIDSASEVDGLTGASMSNLMHGTPITTSWDLLDRNNEPVPAGTYRVQIEHTNANAHLIPIDQNVTANGSVDFIIGDDAYTNESSDTYVDISVEYTP